MMKSSEAGFTDDAAAKAAILRVHMPVAFAVLALTLGRLVWWWRFDRKPGPVGGAPAWQDAAGRWTHRALYLLVIVMLASGIGMSVLSGLPDAVFGTAPMPELADLPPRAAHGIAARVLAALVLLHIAAALYHHLVLKDATLRRMWFR
jgi:cytochrome b561